MAGLALYKKYNVLMVLLFILYYIVLLLLLHPLYSSKKVCDVCVWGGGRGGYRSRHLLNEYYRRTGGAAKKVKRIFSLYQECDIDREFEEGGIFCLETLRIEPQVKQIKCKNI
jgi:hypothetical protein